MYICPICKKQYEDCATLSKCVSTHAIKEAEDKTKKLKEEQLKITDLKNRNLKLVEEINKNGEALAQYGYDVNVIYNCTKKGDITKATKATKTTKIENTKPAAKVDNKEPKDTKVRKTFTTGNRTEAASIFDEDWDNFIKKTISTGQRTRMDEAIDKFVNELTEEDAEAILKKIFNI